MRVDVAWIKRGRGGNLDAAECWDLAGSVLKREKIGSWLGVIRGCEESVGDEEEMVGEGWIQLDSC